MDKITSGKILVGSTKKAIDKAKLFGTLKLKELYILNIINELNNFCELNKSFEISKKLNQLAIEIQNKYPQICNYRHKSFDNLFVNGKTKKDTNSIASTNTAPVATDFNCYNYEYEEFSFTQDLFTSRYSDADGDEPKFLRIKSLPLLGSLEFNGVPVIIDQIILLEDIQNLTYDLNLVYSDAVNVTFDFQIGDSNINTLYSNIATFFICVPERRNNPPTVDDESGSLGPDNCRTFVYDDFTNNFQDPDEGDIPFEVNILTLPSIGELTFEGNTISTPFIFDISDVNELRFCLPENYSIIDGVIYEYSAPLDELISECIEDGFSVESVTNGTYNLTKSEEISITNTTNVYAFFDTTSIQQQDGVDAKNALQTWFDDFNTNNPDFTGNLYVIPLNNERWVFYGTMPWTGQFGNPTTSGQWSTIAQLPPNINTPQWVPDPDAVVLAFVDETHTQYHSGQLADGFGGTVQGGSQPSTQYVNDFVSFRDIYSNYNFFRGLIYPIVQSLTGTGGSLVLQAMAALEGKVLTQPEIDAYNTQVDVSLLLTTNPYTNFPIPATSPQEFLEPLVDYDWQGQLDKTSPASAVFNSTTFANDLNSFLQGSTETVITTKQIVGTLITDQPITFDFQTSDDDVLEQLFSNTATYTITYGNLSNQPPSQVGDRQISILNDEERIFTRNDFTSLTAPPYLDPENDPASKLLILTLPDEGELIFNGLPVNINDEIMFTDIDLGLFKYIPDDSINNYTVDFDFEISDTGSGQFTG